jgi:hypothetical protein
MGEVKWKTTRVGLATRMIEPLISERQLLVEDTATGVDSPIVAPTDKEFSNLKKTVETLATSIAALQSRGWWMWIRRHPIHSVISGIILLGAIWPVLSFISSHIREDFGYAVGARIDAKLKEPIAEINVARGDISEIKGKLDGLIKGIVFDRFDKSANLSQKEFNRKLPEIQSLISLAKQQGVSVDPALVHRVGQKLLSVQPRAADFWSTGPATQLQII